MSLGFTNQQAFLGFTASYLLTKVVPAFWFTVIILTSIFVVPLVSSLQGRRAAHDASVCAQELANTAAKQAKELAHNEKVKATELSSEGKQIAADLSEQARANASDMSETAAENIRKLPQMGANAINGNSDENQSVAGGTSNKTSHLSNSASETAKRMTPGFSTRKQPGADDWEKMETSLPTQTGGKRTDSVVDKNFKCADSRNAAATHGPIDRPRGVSQATTDGA